MNPSEYQETATADSKPNRKGRDCNRKRAHVSAPQKLASNVSVDQKRNRAENHRPAFERHIPTAVLPEGEGETGERNRWRGTEQAREPLRTKHASTEGKHAYYDSSDQETQHDFSHTEFLSVHMERGLSSLGRRASF
jgi:hypothetical protein